jgi:hypothetical protein
VSDFILPDDIRSMANQVSQDIADAWNMLKRICVVKQHPMDLAESFVVSYMGAGLTEVESIRKVYHEIAKS